MGSDQNNDSPVGLLWHHPAKVKRDILLFSLEMEAQVLPTASTAEDRRLLINAQQGQKSPLELLWHYQARVSLDPHHSLAKMEVQGLHLVFAGIDENIDGNGVTGFSELFG